VSLDSALLELFRCPDEHHAELTYDAQAQTLTCVECGRIFPIRDGIPILLLDEATLPGAAAEDAGSAAGETAPSAGDAVPSAGDGVPSAGPADAGTEGAA
jgi:uncharacterized protein YbaR (Trm112 family)